MCCPKGEIGGIKEGFGVVKVNIDMEVKKAQSYIESNFPQRKSPMEFCQLIRRITQDLFGCLLAPQFEWVTQYVQQPQNFEPNASFLLLLKEKYLK